MSDPLSPLSTELIPLTNIVRNNESSSSLSLSLRLARFRNLPALIWPCEWNMPGRTTAIGGNQSLLFTMSLCEFPPARCQSTDHWQRERERERIALFSYGLLGPSGCGKTTLLRCIIGRLQLNRGELSVLGARPGSRGHQVPGRDVGFMPQETALYKEFSISEILHYFGHLHHMERKEILQREQFLLSFLDLPSRSKRISQLRFDLFLLQSES